MYVVSSFVRHTMKDSISKVFNISFSHKCFSLVFEILWGYNFALTMYYMLLLQVACWVIVLCSNCVCDCGCSCPQQGTKEPCVCHWYNCLHPSSVYNITCTSQGEAHKTYWYVYFLRFEYLDVLNYVNWFYPLYWCMLKSSKLIFGIFNTSYNQENR